jgi:membrane fusion protein, heavy metal efflux system
MLDALFASPSSRGRGRHAAVLAAALSYLPFAIAADPPAAFAVSAAQMQSLGIQLHRLGDNKEIAGVAYSARVVLPPKQQQVIAAPLTGVVDQLLVTENERVGAGQPVIRLLSPELGELQFKLMEAASRQALADKTLQRERQLLADGIIPERRVQEAEAAAMEVAARRKQAEAALRLAGMDDGLIRRLANGSSSVESVVVLRARAPGIVTELTAKPGQRVQPAEPLMQVADSRVLWLDIQVPLVRQAEVATAKGGSVTLVGRNDVQASVLSAGSGVGDGQSFVLRAEVHKGAQTLRPGEFVQVRLPSSAPEGWAVPLQAVAREGDKAHVFVRTESGFNAKPVTILASGGNSLRVQGDLRAGDQIATSSVIALKAAWQGKGGSN